jgi:uncharacterized protein with PQ loop repeat
MFEFIIKCIGLLGGCLLALAAAPTAYKTLKAQKSIGTPVSIGLLLIAGLLFTYVYITATYGFDWVILTNFLLEGGSWLIIIKYHFLPKDSV